MMFNVFCRDVVRIAGKLLLAETLIFFIDSLC